MTLDKKFMQPQPLTPPADFAADPAVWFALLAKEHHLNWLLAHADDGVIWGAWRDGGWQLSSVAFPEVSPALRGVTLQAVRLFGENSEVFIWRTETTWRARLIADGLPLAEHYDERTLLWGDHVQQQSYGFVLLEQGAEGLRHAPPLVNGQPPAYLTVRHYLNADDDGQARVSMSRLVKLEGRE